LTVRNQRGGTTAGIYFRDVVTGTFEDLGLDHIGTGGWCNTAIFGYGCTEDTTFQRLFFDACHEGIHIWWYGSGTVPQRTRLQYCVFTNTGRYPIELQGAANDLDVSYNWMDLWPVGTGKMGISCATGGDPSNSWGTLGDNIFVHHNTIGDTGLGPVKGNESQFSAIEFMGKSGGVYNNTVFGFGYGVIYGYVRDGWFIRDNTFVGVKNMTGAEWSGLPAPKLSGNVEKPAGAIPVPPPPTTQTANPITNVVATEANPPVLTWTGGAATITRTDKDGKTDVQKDGTPAIFLSAASPWPDNFIPLDHYESTWHVKYIVGTVTSNTIQLPKPTVTPPPPSPGVIVTQEAEVDSGGKIVRSTATTKPRTVAP
jgi:hypothetical protein